MKKSVNTELMVGRMSEPANNQRKYRMRISLTEELNNLIKSRNSASEENIQLNNTLKRVLPSTIKAGERMQVSEKESFTQFSRASSKELSKIRKMHRSNSEFLKPAQQYQSILSHKTNEFAYRSLLRHYQHALFQINAPKILKERHISSLLCSLGFLPNLASQQDGAVIATIKYMLSAPSKNGVTHENLFVFLLIVCNISVEIHDKKQETGFISSNAASALSDDSEPSTKPLIVIQIGTFDGGNYWRTTDFDRKKIRKIFGKLYYNKISSEELKYKKVEEQERPSFQPQILNHSREIANAKRSQILRQAHQYCEVWPQNRESIDLAQLMMLDKKIKQEKINLKVKQKQNLQQFGCTFQPKINKPHESVKTQQSTAEGNQSKDRCIELFEKSKQVKSIKIAARRPTLEEIELNQLKECTFKPTSTKYKGSKPSQLPIRNEHKLVGRLKEGRELRLLNETLKNRGYPQNKNWAQFVKDYKRKIGPSNPAFSAYRKNNQKSATEEQIYQRVPLLSMDIKLHNDTCQLEVFHGDTVESLAQRILLRHGLPQDRLEKINALISNVISNCSGMRVVDGIVHQVEV